MSNQKISELVDGSPLADGDELVVARVGANVRITADPIVTALSGSLPASGTALDVFLRELKRRELPGFSAIPTVAASPPTLTAGASGGASAITNSVLVPCWETTAMHYDGTRPQFRTAGGTTDDYYSNPTGVATAVYPSGNTSNSPWAVEFLIYTSDGQFEICSRGSGGGCRVIVDGFAATALASFTHSADGQKYNDLVSGLSAGWHKVRVEMEGNFRFRGIQQIPTNAIRASRSRSQLWIAVGDSFTEPTIDDSNGTFKNLGWVQRLGWMLGVEAWSAGKGSTGYLEVGSNVKFRDRLAQDVLANAPDVIVWAGGINDYANFTAAAIGAEALACFQAAQAALPGVIQIVLSPFWPRGYSTLPANIIYTDAQIKAAAAQVPNTLFLDLLRYPAPTTGATGGPLPAATTLAADAAIAATSISANAQYPVGTYMQIGADSDTAAEIRVVTGRTGTGPYTLQFGSDPSPGLLNAHHAGDPVTPVGGMYMTGTGKQGATTGDGTADVFTGNGGTHPTVPGHENIACAVFRLLHKALPA